MLDHISGGVGLQSERTKVVAEKAADCELGLLLIAGNRMSEVAGAVGHRSELPFAELFDSRQVDIDEIRIAAVEAERNRAWRDLRSVGDLVKLDAIDDVRRQVPVIACIAQREALIERGRTERHRLVDVGIGTEGITKAKSIAEVPSQLPKQSRVEYACV